MDIPLHGEALARLGPAFLTDAFRIYGSLPHSNKVVAITRLERCVSGSTGDKFFLSVVYDQSEPGLHTELFVKFSRDFSNSERDARGKFEMEGEVRFASLTRKTHLPVPVPRPYFADYHASTKSGLLITERIEFGRDGIEPQHAKCADHQLTDPLAYYRVIVRALGEIAAFGAHNRDLIDRKLPYDPVRAAAGLRISIGESQLVDKVRSLADFVTQHPQLFPCELRDPAILASVQRFAPLFLHKQSLISKSMVGHRDLISLCHWNANIDNCWFWRDQSGTLQCGLIDWGNAGQLNLAFALWGCLSAAPLHIWNCHLDALLTLFATTIERSSGICIDLNVLRQNLDMYVTAMGLSYFLDAGQRILDQVQGVAAASGPNDPVIAHNERARNQLHITKNVLNYWRLRDISETISLF